MNIDYSFIKKIKFLHYLVKDSLIKSDFDITFWVFNSINNILYFVKEKNLFY